MRLLRFGISYVLVNILLLLVAAFLAQNAHPEHITYFGLTVAVNMAVILVGAVAFGFVVALAILVPGRIASSFHAWGLDREAEQLEQQVAQLRVQREDLLDRLDDLVDGNERIVRRYHHLVAEHREVVTDRDQMRVLLGRITGPLPVASPAAVASPAPVAKGTEDKGYDSTTSPEEEVATAPTSVSVAPAQGKMPSLARITRRLLPSAISEWTGSRLPVHS
jgi:hypothetical protein